MLSAPCAINILTMNQWPCNAIINFRFEDIFKDDISVEKAKNLFILNEKRIKLEKELL